MSESREAHSGHLFKYTNLVRGWQMRWFVLVPGLRHLEYYRREDDAADGKPRGWLYLGRAEIRPSEDDFGFRIRVPGGCTLRLRAASPEARDAWVSKLRRVVEMGFAPLQPPADGSEDPALTLYNAEQALLRLRHTTELLVADIEALPTQGSLTHVDQGLLRIKATSAATLHSLQKCFDLIIKLLAEGKPSINLRSGVAPGGGKEESPTSDYAEECPSEQGESTCSSVTSSSPLPQPNKNRHPHHIPYDPKIHVTSKPPYSFSCLIFMSIEDSKGKALPVKEIYTWILDHFPYYRNAPTGWKNSVRHNLSLNKCFRKVDKAPNLGKGSLWMVDPVFRPNLVQALMKAPYHPYTNLERNNSATHFQRRRSESSASEEEEEVPLDAEDAAAAMLVLKHGPHAKFHIQREEFHKRHKPPSILYNKDGRHRLNYRKEEDYPGSGRQSEDHTYSSVESNMEPDEAFMEGSDSNSTCSLHIFEEDDGRGEDPEEERRKTAEGADALLNLAGIKTNGLAVLGLERKRHLPRPHAACATQAKRKPQLPHRLKAKR